MTKNDGRRLKEEVAAGYWPRKGGDRRRRQEKGKPGEYSDQDQEGFGNRCHNNEKKDCNQGLRQSSENGGLRKQALKERRNTKEIGYDAEGESEKEAAA